MGLNSALLGYFGANRGIFGLIFGEYRGKYGLYSWANIGANLGYYYSWANNRSKFGLFIPGLINRGKFGLFLGE